MSGISGIVAPGHPYRITQIRNRRQPTFFSDDDYAACIDITTEWCHLYGVEIWAYRLATGHVHRVAVPKAGQKTKETAPVPPIQTIGRIVNAKT